jgi:hypothetical protein
MTPARRPLTVAFIDAFHGSHESMLGALARNFDVREDASARSPDVVFCGEDRFDDHRQYPDALKIWVQHENRYPDYAKYHYVIGYRYLDPPRYFREPLYARTARPEALLKDAGFVERTVAQKTEFCCIVNTYANPVRVWRRLELCDRLDAYKPMAYGGRWRNNVGGPVKDKLAFYRPYKFAVCFDNGCMSGYTTEKITDAFETGCIPIFLGNADIAREFNPKSFVNAHECRTLAEVVERVAAIDRDEALYRQVLAEPWFNDNRPNEVFDLAPLAAFLKRAVESPRPPLYPVYPPYRFFDLTRKFNFYLDYYLGKAGIRMWGPV